MREILEHLKDVCIIVGMLVAFMVIMYYFAFWIVVALVGYLLYTTFIKK